MGSDTLVPKVMLWMDADEDDFGDFGDPEPLLSMNVWLDEENGVAYADKAGTIRVRDLDIEVSGEIGEEKFEPREV